MVISSFCSIFSSFLMIDFPRIEELHWQLGSSKIDDLATKSDNESILMILELAGRTNTSIDAKLEADCLKLYKNTVKALKHSTKDQMYTVL